jgi:hypothetical protein
MINFDRSGRQLSSSKQEPKGHECVWNANVCTKSKGKIWFGDLDLTLDGSDLAALAKREGEMIYVLREMDGRFMNEASPKFENAVARYGEFGRLEA